MDTDPPSWENDYARRGRLWGGVTGRLPELPPGSSVLELGCGDGKTLAAMAERRWNVTALDISPTAVRMSRARFGTTGTRLLVADARSLPLRDGSFDAAFLFHITGHLLADGRARIAAETSRVLRDGGLLFFRAFSTEDMRAGKGTEVEEHTYRRGDAILTHYFTAEETADLFSMLTPVSVQTHRWQMRIRGNDYPRVELEALFRKNR